MLLDGERNERGTPSQGQVVHGISAISKIDSKGRVSIPVGLRYKLRLVEGSAVSLKVKNGELVLSSIDNPYPQKISSDNTNSEGGD